MIEVPVSVDQLLDGVCKSLQRSHTLHANSTTLILKHYSPAHTDSDISVHFVEADVFHTGDTFWNGNYPFIDYSTGGSIDGMIRATEANLGKVTDKMIVIPGTARSVTNHDSPSIMTS